MQKIGKGDFNFLIDEKIINTKSKEINDIIGAFNIMIKELRSREVGISKKNALFYAILNSTPSPVLIFDNNLNLVHYNNSCIPFYKKINFDYENKIKFDDFDFLLKFKNSVKKVLNEKKSLIKKYDYSIQTSRKVLFFNIIIFKIFLFDENLVAIRIDDITEQEEKKQALIESQKYELIGTLAGGLSHDLNNILNIITSSVSVLEIKKEQNILTLEEEKKYLQRIGEATFRASKLVRQLLTLAKKAIPEKTIFEVNKFIENCIDIASNSIDKSINIKFKRYFEKIYIYADPNQIEQVLLNLLFNAAHAMTIMKPKDQKWGGELTVISSLINKNEELFCEIEISDTGVGISKENLKKIFTPFFTTKKEKGSGLGLSMVKDIIEAHDGKIKFYSKENIGTTVKIFLPVAKNNQNDKEFFKDNFIDKLNGTVLLVDDEKDIREAMKEILNLFGLNVIIAGDGLKAIDIYKSKYEKIDIIFLDLVMPYLSGNEILKKILNINSEAKVIITSGFKEDERIKDCLNLGAVDFLAKPYNVYDVYRKIFKILKG